MLHPFAVPRLLLSPREWCRDIAGAARPLRAGRNGHKQGGRATEMVTGRAKDIASQATPEVRLRYTRTCLTARVSVRTQH